MLFISHHIYLISAILNETCPAKLLQKKTEESNHDFFQTLMLNSTVAYLTNSFRNMKELRVLLHYTGRNFNASNRTLHHFQVTQTFNDQ